METKKKYNFFFILLLFFFIGIRFFGLDQPIFDDETNYVQSINNPGPFYTINPFRIHAHPPLGGWTYFLAGNLLGQDILSYRLVPFFFWLINIILIYLIVSNEYSKRAALFSSLIMGISYYSLLMSMQIEVDSNLLVTTFLLTTYFYLRYINTKKLKWLIFTGFFFGTALLTKISGIFFFGVIGFHLFLTNNLQNHNPPPPHNNNKNNNILPNNNRFSSNINHLFKQKGINGLTSDKNKAFGSDKKNKISTLDDQHLSLKNHLYLSLKNDQYLFLIKHLRKTITPLIIILFFGLIIFSIFPILTFDFFQQMLNHSTSYFGLNISWMAVAMLLFWATPLLLGLFFFQMIKFERKDLFWIIWFWLIFGIYTFLIIGRPGTQGASGGVADYSRHFMNLIAPLSVLGGVFVSKIKFNWKQLLYGTLVGIIVLLLFFLMNLNTDKLLPRDFSVYSNSLKSLELNFLFSFTTSSGNLLGVNMGIIVLSIFFSGLLILIYLLLKYFRQFQLSKWALLLFIAVGVALNIFLCIEYLGPLTSPDFNNIFNEMVDYTRENNLEQPLFVNDEGLLLHLNNLQYETGENQYNLGKYFEGLSSHMPLRGTVLIFNWPPISKENSIWEAVHWCDLKKSFYSKEFLIGEIYTCSNLSEN